MKRSIRYLLEYDSPRIVPDLYEMMQQRSDEERTGILRDLDEIYSSSVLDDVSLRIGFCQLLVALAPMSADFLKKIMSSCARALDFEIHFTLFCWLDSIQYIGEEDPGLLAFREEVPTLVEEYLYNVPRTTGHGAWMAGDILGHHWHLSPTLSILFEVDSSGPLCSRQTVSAGRS